MGKKEVLSWKYTCDRPGCQESAVVHATRLESSMPPDWEVAHVPSIFKNAQGEEIHSSYLKTVFLCPSCAALNSEKELVIPHDSRTSL